MLGNVSDPNILTGPDPSKICMRIRVHEAIEYGYRSGLLFFAG